MPLKETRVIEEEDEADEVRDCAAPTRGDTEDVAMTRDRNN